MNESDFTKKTSNIWALLWTLFLSVNTDVSPPGSCHRRFSGWCWLVSLDEPAGCRWRSKQLRGWHARTVSLVPERLKEGALGRDCARCPPCRSGVRSGPGRPAAWRPASSSAGLVPGGGPPARSSELENKQSRVFVPRTKWKKFLSPVESDRGHNKVRLRDQSGLIIKTRQLWSNAPLFTEQLWFLCHKWNAPVSFTAAQNSLQSTGSTGSKVSGLWKDYWQLRLASHLFYSKF